MITLLLQNIGDLWIRKNFELIQKEINLKQPILRADWHFVEIKFVQAETNFKYPHKLDYVPLDILLTSEIGAGVATFNYALFDKTNLDITTTGPCTVRFFIGTYKEGSFV